MQNLAVIKLGGDCRSYYRKFIMYCLPQYCLIHSVVHGLVLLLQQTSLMCVLTPQSSILPPTPRAVVQQRLPAASNIERATTPALQAFLPQQKSQCCLICLLICSSCFVFVFFTFLPSVCVQLSFVCELNGSKPECFHTNKTYSSDNLE